MYVVADRKLLSLVAEQLPSIPAGNLMGEPVGRNTAAALAAEAIDRPGDEVMLVLPADAHIADEKGFRAALAVAGDVAKSGSLVTLGVTPDHPETGYGYVLAQPPAREVGGRPTFSVQRFVEKPTVEQAQELIATGLASWNAGIFAWTRTTIRDRLMRYAPDITGPLRSVCEAAATPGPGPDLDAVYPGLRATSIDYAVMEPASLQGDVAVVPMTVGWSDLGSWAALRDAWQAAGKPPSGMTAGLGNRRDLGSANSLVFSGGRLVVTIGLDNVIVVDTPDALLVCSAEHSQEVRAIAEEVSKARRESAVKEQKS